MRSQRILFWSPILFLFCIWLLFSSPYILHHDIPYPARDQVSSFGPWNLYPKFQGPVKNASLSDVINEIYPWKFFTIQMLKNGQFPFWNPFSFSGNPNFADYQTAVLSPFNILFFLFPFNDAWALLILLQPLLAGVFTYLYLRILRISAIGSLIAGVSFMFCGFLVCWMAWGTLGMAIAFLPLCLYAVEKYFDRGSVFCLFLLALGIICSFFSGHFQTSAYVAVESFAYCIFKGLSTKNFRAFFVLLGSFCAACLVCLAQIIPSIHLYDDSIRSTLFANASGIPWYYLVTTVAPDFFGNPVTRNDWVGSYAEWASFIGIIPLTLSPLGFFEKQGRRIWYFFAFSGIIALLLSLNTPLLQVLQVFKIPVFATSIPSRIIVIFSFSIAVLSGLGIDCLSKGLNNNKIRSHLLVFCGMGLVLIGLFGFLLFSKVLTHSKDALAMKNLLLPTGLFFISFLSLLAVFFLKRKKFVRVYLLLLLLLTSIDSFRFAQKWMPFDPSTLIFPAVPVISVMQKDRGQGRVFGDYFAYIDTYYQIPSIQGYDPLYSREYGEFLQSSSNGTFSPALRSVAKLDTQGLYADRVLDLLGVTLIYQPKNYTFEPWGFPVWQNTARYPLVYEDSYIGLYKNTTAMPRAALFSRFEVIKNNKRLISRLYTKDFDFRHILLLQNNPGYVTPSAHAGSARIVSYTPDNIVIQVHSSGASLLFLSDTYYPSWAAKINGQSVPILRADYAFRAVVVPQGYSIVEFMYRSLF